MRITKNFFVCIYILFFFITGSLLVVNAAPSDLDSSFGGGGKVTTPVGDHSRDRAFAVAQQADGKILVAGDSVGDDAYYTDELPIFIVSRINADGSLDRSFGFNGTATHRFPGSNGRAAALVVQPDGKIIAGGVSLIFVSSSNSYFNHFYLTRFNSDGSVDRSFGTNGTVITTFNINGGTTNSALTSIALQQDGKIVAAGVFGTSGSMAVARYNTDGSLDAAFDADGKLLININPDSGNRANAVVIQNDGKIVLGGSARNIASSVTDFALVRLNTDGSFDTTFDADGRLTTKISAASSEIKALKIQSDGKIVAAGTSNSIPYRDVALARYNPDGSLDTTFDGDGLVITNVGDDVVSGLAVQSDGKITVGGYTNTNGAYDFLSIRYNTNGTLDNTYNGQAVTVPSQFADLAMGILIQTDGKVLIAGYTDIITDSNIVLVRNNANGSRDTSFDGDGIAFIELGNARDVIYKTAIQPDGKIVAAGYSFGGEYQNLTLVRYNTNGSLDTSFGNQGKIIMPFTDFNSSAGDLIIQPDGKIVVAAVIYQTPANFVAVRFNPNGSLDTLFGTAGIASFQVESNSGYRLALQPDGKIILAGGGVALARLNANGSLDASFGGGTVITSVSNRETSLTAIALQSDGKIVVSGYSKVFYTTNYSFFVSRYNTNGSLDTTFGGTGTIYTSITNYDVAPVVAIQPDNKIVAAGYGADGYILVRYNTDGSLDSTFDADGKVTTFVRTNAYSQISDIAVQQNGKIIVVGYAGDESHRVFNATVFRYNSDGSLDNSFGSNGKIFASLGESDNRFYSVSLQLDGKIVAAGYSSNGANDDFTVVRYQGDSTAAPGRTKFDFDGDGKADVSVFRLSNGTWYLNQSTAGFAGTAFGFSTDRIVPADYDGDGKTDIAVFRGGTWYILRSQLGFTGISFGDGSDVPQPADYDGDGKADVAVFRPSNGNWYLQRSQLGFTGIAFGQTGDKPVAADYDGDGKTDVAVYRNGIWYIQRSTLGFTGITFGDGNDKPVPADYDGDGKADVAVFRPSNGAWYLQRSQLGFTGVTFGVSTDLPTPADYDGDGKSDVAVFRNGTWYLQRSAQGFTGVSFGSSDDKPVPSAFVP